MKRVLGVLLVAALLVNHLPAAAQAVVSPDEGRLWRPGSGLTRLSLPAERLPANRADLLSARGAGDCRQVCERKKYGFDPDTVICHEECPYSPNASGYNNGSGLTPTRLWIAGAIVVGIIIVLFAAASRSKPSSLQR